jgi:hypothetical protein
VAMARMARERVKRKARKARKGNLPEADRCGHVDISRGFAPQKKKQGKKAKPRSDFRHAEERKTTTSSTNRSQWRDRAGFTPASGFCSGNCTCIRPRLCTRIAVRATGHLTAGPFAASSRRTPTGENRHRPEMIYYNIHTVFLFVNAALSARYREACLRLLIAGIPQPNVSVSWRTPCPRRPRRR